MFHQRDDYAIASIVTLRFMPVLSVVEGIRQFNTTYKIINLFPTTSLPQIPNFTHPLNHPLDETASASPLHSHSGAWER